MTVGTKIILGFAVALAALAALGLLTHQSTTRLVAAGQAVTHTHEVLTDLEAVLSLMKDAETGQRGYLLTAGVKSYLGPYTGAREKVRNLLQHLREMTKDNPAQQGRLDQLRPLL